MSGMGPNNPVQTNQPQKKLNLWLILFVVMAILFILAVVYGFSIYGKEQNYKNNVTQKVNAAVNTAVQQTQNADKQAYYAQAEKPLQTYTGPSNYGSIVVEYPKNWSAYVETANGQGGGTSVNGYFQPDYVPNTDSQSVFALRVELVQQSYDSVLQQYNGKQSQGLVTVKPYSLPKVPNVIGVRIEGEVQNNKQGSLVLLPLRAQTLEIWTESTQYEPDFNNNILPNLSFSP